MQRKQDLILDHISFLFVPEVSGLSSGNVCIWCPQVRKSCCDVTQPHLQKKGCVKCEKQTECDDLQISEHLNMFTIGQSYIKSLKLEVIQ